MTFFLNRSTALTTTQVAVNTSIGALTIPVSGSLTFNGRESKIVVTDYVFGLSNTGVLYSTAEYVDLSLSLSLLDVFK